MRLRPRGGDESDGANGTSPPRISCRLSSSTFPLPPPLPPRDTGVLFMFVLLHGLMQKVCHGLALCFRLGTPILKCMRIISTMR